MSKGSSTNTVTQKSDPWKPAQPYLQDLLGQASGQFQQGGQYAPFSTVVPFSNQTNQALGGLEDFANAGGTPGIQQSQNALGQLLNGNQQLQSTANGDYLNSNPYLDKMYQAASGPVMDQVNSYFSQGGRSGSDTQAGELTKQLGNLSANIYGQNYANERTNQLNAANTIGQQQLGGLTQAGNINQLAQSPLQTLLGVGQAYEGQAGNQLQDLLNRWNYGQQQPWQNLQQYAGLLGGIGGSGSSSSTTSPTGSNLGNILGGAAGIGSLFGSGGALSGLFGGGAAAGSAGSGLGSLAALLAI